MANQIETEPTLVVEKETPRDRPFLGWLAITDGVLRGEAFHLYEGRNRVGSSPACNIQIPEEGVQDQHLSIRIASRQWTLTDLDSDTGTFLNGKRVYRNELKDGDRIKIGRAVLQIKIL